jgi:CelD/BcsL family acetyltransferase involved in cellulose biosynthesis
MSRAAGVEARATGARIAGEIVTEAAALDAIRPEWNAAAADHGNLYLTHEWVVSLWESHFERRGVDFYVLRGVAFQGIVPLVREPIRKHGFPFLQYGLVTNRYGRNHNELLLRGDPDRALRTVLAELRKRRCDIFLVGSVPEDSATAPLLERVAREEGFRSIVEDYVRSPYLTLEGTWDDYLKGKSVNFRSDLKRKGNKAARASAEFRMLTKAEDVPFLLETVYGIETKSWKEQSQTSITTNTAARTFYDRFLPRAAAAGWLHSFVLHLEGRPVAYDMGVLFANRYYMLKTSYDSEWSEWSPGIVLRQHVMRHLFEIGAREHDFLGDDEAWKLRWTSTLRHHRHYYLYDTRRWPAALYSKLRAALAARGASAETMSHPGREP